MPNLTIGDMLAIIGIPLALLFGFFTIYFGKKTIKKYHLSLILSEAIGLVKSFSEQMENIKILHKGTEIESNIYLLKYFIVNHGDFDIDRTTIYDPVRINFPENIEILECNLSESHSMPVAIKNSHLLIINWDLLKKNELIQLNILVKIDELIIEEYKKGKILKGFTDFLIDKIEVTGRISNIENIEKKKIEKSDFKKKPSKVLLVFTIIIVSLLFLFIIFPPDELLYKYTTNGNDYTVTFNLEEIYGNKTIKIRDLKGNLIENQSINIFPIGNIKGIIVGKDSSSTYYAAMIAMSILCVGFVIFLVFDRYLFMRNKRVIRILKKL